MICRAAPKFGILSTGDQFLLRDPPVPIDVRHLIQRPPGHLSRIDSTLIQKVFPGIEPPVAVAVQLLEDGPPLRHGLLDVVRGHVLQFRRGDLHEFFERQPPIGIGVQPVKGEHVIEQRQRLVEGHRAVPVVVEAPETAHQVRLPVGGQRRVPQVLRELLRAQTPVGVGVHVGQHAAGLAADGRGGEAADEHGSLVERHRSVAVAVQGHKEQSHLGAGHDLD
eukprot:CAMPEP_0194334254 /NCGR_PEP_ID=MMETSP0171-20130528/65496_1 /TAXON_ID=218684 /ORGANISM="Corethron pennatum, Strain L29A3" /LENGTH=221 /DNA_ID=CAMNT_0039096825 /DNA_START=124 /DNA_END=789 /DNA_ORIENTATION=-